MGPCISASIAGQHIGRKRLDALMAWGLTAAAPPALPAARAGRPDGSASLGQRRPRRAGSPRPRWLARGAQKGPGPASVKFPA